MVRRALALLAPAASIASIAASTAHAANEQRPPHVVVFCEESLRPVQQAVANVWRVRSRAPVYIFVARTCAKA